MNTQLFKDVFPGLYIGIVEYTNDPAQLGRIKVRVPNINGLENINTENLPWATPCFPFGGGPGFGSIMIPPEGATVYVSFLHGNPHNPVYIGTFYGNPSDEQEFLRNNKKTLPTGAVSMAPENQSWKTPPGPEPPREFLIQSNNRPERLVPFKSIKGASIDINDKDEEEKVALHDRTGQAIILESNVSRENNINNSNARGLKSSYEGDAVKVDKTLTKEGTISIVDIGGQSIVLHTKENNSKISLMSKDIDITENTQKEIEGNSTIVLDLASGDKKVLLEIRDNGVSKAKLVLDGNTGYFEVVSPLLVKITSQNIMLNGNTTIDGNLTVTKNILSLNDKIN